MDEKELEQKLDEIDKKVTPSYLRKRLKLALYKKVEAGDISALDDIKRLETLEATPEAAATASSPQPSSPDRPSGEEGALPPDPAEAEENRKSAIVERLHIRPRAYTMTEAARKQRSKAASSQAHADAMKGNKNAWKTGQHAQGFIRQLFRPCLSTCPQYPCELIDDGETAAGSICLDKTEFVKGLQALQKALRNNDLTDLKELAALRLAGNMDILGQLQEDILSNGVKVLSEKLDKDGKVIGYELEPNPSLLVLPKLSETLGINPAEWMISPREIKRQKTETRKAKTLAGIMSGIGLGNPDDKDQEEADEE